MINSLDLLIIVFLFMIGVGLLCLSLMFLARNTAVKKVCLYLVSGLAAYVGYVGVRIGFGMFYIQVAVGVLAAAAAVTAIVLAATDKDNGKKFKAARLIGAAALVAGMINAIL